MLQARLVSHYLFELFVDGSTNDSTRALNAVHSICSGDLAGADIWLRLSDVSTNRERARENFVTRTPTLIRILPLPSVRIVGEFEAEDLLKMMSVDGSDR